MWWLHRVHNWPKVTTVLHLRRAAHLLRLAGSAGVQELPDGTTVLLAGIEGFRV